MTPHSNRKIAVGVAWLVALRLMDRSIGLLSTLILARLLYPADFGLISLATGVTTMLELLLSFSFEVALVQHPQPTRAHYDSAWTMNLILSAGIGLGLVALRGPASAFYSDARIGGVLWWLALGAVFDGLANIRVVDFQRDMQFDRNFRITLTRRLVVFAVTIGGALALRSYWALLIGILTGKFVYLVMSYVMRPYRPRFDLSELHGLLGISRWLLVFNILSYAVQRGGEVALGRYVGQAATGIFAISHELATLPTAEMVAPVNRAALPAYSRLAGDLPRLRDTYLDVLRMTSLVTAPAAVGIAATSDLIVAVFLGERWSEAGLPVKILAIYSGLLSLQTNTGAVYTALGRTRLIAIVGAIKVVVLVPLLVVLTPRYGILGAAWSYAIATGVLMPFSFGILHRALDLGNTQFAAAVWRPLAGAAILYAGLPGLTGLLGIPAWPSHLAALLGEVLAGAVLYTVAVATLWAACGRPAGAETNAWKIAQLAAGKARASWRRLLDRRRN